MSGIEWLRSLHTKQLLKLKNEYYNYLRIYGFISFDEVTFTYQELKQILSKRSHIPNGADTKRIRQTAAKRKTRSYQSSN